MRETREMRLQVKTMVTAVAAMVIMILMLGLMTIVSHAEEGRVTASSVKIRESADTGSEMLSGALQGDILTITDEVTGADGYVWYQVTFNGNQTGYVRSDLMEKVSGSETVTASGDLQEVQPISATVNADNVRIRSAASTSGSIVTTVQKDVVLTVTGTVADSEGYTWYQVSFTDSSGEVTGFVRKDYVSLEGELVPADQGVEETEEPGEEEPAASEETETQHKDFETMLNEDGWYLLDYTSGTGYMYSIEDIFEVAETNQTLYAEYEESQAKLKSMKRVVIILVILVILLALAATLLFFKIRDMMDAAYFEEVEKETIRKRQGQRAANRASMPTVGAGGKASAGNQAKAAGGSQQTRASGSQTRPAANGLAKPAGNGQVKQKPVGNSQTKPANGSQQSKTAGGQARPAQQTAKPAQSLSGTAQSAQARPAQQAAKPVQSAAKPAQQTSQNSTWQSKNFMAEDDEFEFEFLNWDGEEDN